MKKLYLLCVLIFCLFYSSNIFAQAASIMWPLTSNTAPDAPTGNIQGSAETIASGLSVFAYNNGQRLWMGNTGWAANSSIVLTRYIQFNVSPASGNNLTVTSLLFNYGDFPLSSDYNILKFQAYYSTDNWNTSTVLNVTPSFYLNSTVSTFSVSNLNVLIANGQTFSLRIYPYSPNGGVPGIPSFAIHDSVIINGTTVPALNTGSICGVKFNDLNSNGVRDQGDPGLQNWVINLKYQNAAGVVTISDTTDAKGDYCFTNLTPGVTYTISETSQTGWHETFPAAPGMYTITLGSGQNIDTLNFGNHLTTAETDSCHFLCNPDFEDNQVVSAGSQGFFNESLISCWKTTESDSIIEVWGSGFNGVPAYSGNQFIELNALTVSTLYQDFTAVSGRTLSISFAHRGRYNNPDVMNAKIGPTGGPYVLLGTYSDNNTAWSYHTVPYTFPSGGSYELRFESVSSNGGAGPDAGGNFLDDISIDCPSAAGGICDSLKATASKTTPGDCSWSLSLSQPANLTGIGSIQIACLSPNQFTTGTGLGPNFQNWFTSTNTYIPPTGHVPGGNLNDFFRMNINYVTSPQIIVVNWLDSLNNKVCSDTLKLDCQISCTTILNDTVTCAGNNYNFSYRFSNNATYGISNIEYTLQGPSGVAVSPLADTLSPALAAGATSGVQNIGISGGMPGDTISILAKYISSGGCCWCFETFKVILPNCRTVCDSLGVQAQGSSNDCCYSISLTNNSSTVFSSVEFQLLSGGMFSTVATTSAPGWGFTNISPNNLINLVRLPFGQAIGHGTFNDVLDMCIRHYSDSTQKIEVRWIKNGQIVCRDTLRFECTPTVPPTDTCSQVIDGTLTCLANGNVRYIFRVQNNSTINSTGFGIFPMTPGASFSKSIFNSTNILPGQVSPIDTIIISGLGQGHQLCLQTSIFVTVDSVYNYCCHSDTMCIATPNCGTKDSSEACITWDLMSTELVTSVNGNISGTPETISAGSSSPFMVIFFPYSNGQRLWVGNTGWVAGPLDPMRYVEFNASPNPGNNFTVTNVSCNYGDLPLSTDFNILNFKAYYSIDGWVNSTVLNSTALIYKNTAMLSFNQAISVLVPNGKTFSLRIYPYAIQNGIAITPTFAIHNNVVVCGTTSTITSIDDGKTGIDLPKSFKMQQNYPNPFNPSSIIQYDIPKTSFVKVSVYDILGREIRVLVNEEKSPGRYEINFDARGLASGIYFYIIRTGEFTQLKKMILMK